ncbi:hypothetical protein BDR05DRAFT_965284 [Suillus weaverae]|nr:hypothetical protein BDR05DRAFT_965284 [Suillus weaverae]
MVVEGEPSPPAPRWTGILVFSISTFFVFPSDAVVSEAKRDQKVYLTCRRNN